jgi:hypothetical protein
VEACDEARIVAAPIDAFAGHLLIFVLSLPGADTDAFTATAEVSVTPERCRVFLGPADRLARKAMTQQTYAGSRDVSASVADLQYAGCTVSFYQDRSDRRGIEVRWTRPFTNRPPYSRDD